MFPSFSVRASFMQEHGKSCFWCNFSVAINSARCVQHCTSACHPVQLKHTCPDLKSLNGLLPTVWAMRSKRDVLPSSIVPLPLAPFFSVLGTPSRYHFQCLQTSKAIRMLDQLLDGHQNCCMWPSHRFWLCLRLYRNESASRQIWAGKKDMSLKLESEEWALIKDRQHIGSVSSAAAWFFQTCSYDESQALERLALKPRHPSKLFQLLLWLHCHDTLCLWADWWPHQTAWKARDVQLFNGFLPCPWCLCGFIMMLSSLSGTICCFDYDASLHGL